MFDHDVCVRDLIPPDLERLPAADDSYREARFLLRGVSIRAIVGVSAVEIVAEGELPDEIRRHLPEIFRSRGETLCKKKCVQE